MKKICVLKRSENTDVENEAYLNAISKFGGNPILIDRDNIDELKNCSGILITGGFSKGDLDDYLISYALENNLPLLGICQGMQSMAMYDTSNLLVDVDNHYQEDHFVILDDSNLRKIIDKDKFIVNSFHHQQVKSSKLFRVVGKSLDGVIEALENENHPFQIGVEWHPERMIESEESKRLFREFIKQIKTHF